MLATHLRGFRCLLVDRPGYGLGELVPNQASVGKGAARWLGAALDALGVERANVVASSTTVPP
jgi:pimeloyl-ACP methyl ester carboxylesterase